MNIGQRAAIAVKEKALQNGIKLSAECERIGTTYASLNCWENGKREPRSYVLGNMHRLGYDVIYILTGERKDNG